MKKTIIIEYHDIYTHFSVCLCIYVHNNLNLERPDVNSSKGRVPFQFYHLNQGHLFIEFQKTNCISLDLFQLFQMSMAQV
jgi:hypothetical protein